MKKSHQDTKKETPDTTISQEASQPIYKSQYYRKEYNTSPYRKQFFWNLWKVSLLTKY